MQLGLQSVSEDSYHMWNLHGAKFSYDASSLAVRCFVACLFSGPTPCMAPPLAQVYPWFYFMIPTIKAWIPLSQLLIMIWLVMSNSSPNGLLYTWPNCVNHMKQPLQKSHIIASSKWFRTLTYNPIAKQDSSSPLYRITLFSSKNSYLSIPNNEVW